MANTEEKFWQEYLDYVPDRDYGSYMWGEDFAKDASSEEIFKYIENNLEDWRYSGRVAAILSAEECPKEVLEKVVEKLAKCDDVADSILEAVVRTPKTTSDMLHRLMDVDAKRDDSWHRSFLPVWDNPNATEDLLNTALENAIFRQKEIFDDDYTFNEGVKILSHPNSTVEMLDKLAKKGYLPKELLSVCGKDKRFPESVRLAGLKSLDTVSEFVEFAQGGVNQKMLPIFVENGINACYNDEDKKALFESVFPHLELKGRGDVLLDIVLKIEDFNVAQDLTKMYIDRFGESKKTTQVTQACCVKELGKREYSETKMKVFLESVNKTIKSGNKKEINKLKEFLFSGQDQDVFNLDHNAFHYFTKHGTRENFETLNNLRAFYGLKTEIQPYSHADADRTDAKRIRFSGMLSAMGENNEHYKRKHTKAFLEFTPDYSRAYQMSDYDLRGNSVLAKMQDEGVKLPVKMLQKAFAEAHIPPETANQFNVTDMSHILIEYRGQSIDDEYGAMADFKEFSAKGKVAVREKFWKKIAQNKALVKFISEDWKRFGVSEDDISQMWLLAKYNGSPCHSDGYRRVYGKSPQVHHITALKDGGENVFENLMVTNVFWGVREYEGGLEDVGVCEVDSHQPQHEYDKPTDFFYLDEEGNVTARPTDKRIKFTTHVCPSNMKEGEHVVYYGGPRAENCCLMDGKGRIKQAEFDVSRQETVQKCAYRVKTLLWQNQEEKKREVKVEKRKKSAQNISYERRLTDEIGR